MVRKEIGSIFDRINRNNMNDNFEYLFEGSNRIDALSSHAENILNEANRINEENISTQKQIDNLILSKGQSDAEVIQARGNSPLLKDRLNNMESDTKKNENAMKYRDFARLGVIKYPDDFDRVLPFNLYVDEYGKVQHDFNFDTLHNQSNATVYWDWVNGTTGMDGTDPGFPTKRFNKVMETVSNMSSDTVTIEVMNRLVPYTELGGKFSSTLNKNVIIKPHESIDRSIITTARDTTTFNWTKDGNSYYATRSAVVEVIDAKFKDFRGNPMSYRKVNTLSQNKNTPGSYYIYNSDQVYIHTYDGRKPDADVGMILPIGYEIHFIIDSNFLFLDNISYVFASTTGNALKVSGIESSKFYARNSIFAYGETNGLGTSRVGEVYTFNCQAFGNGSDGFNYHGTNGESPYEFVFEYYDYAHENGHKVGGTGNATTAHDGMTILRVGSIGHDCNGPILADVNGCYSLNYNCTMFDSVRPNGRTRAGFYFDDVGKQRTDSKYYLINCGGGGIETMTVNTDGRADLVIQNLEGNNIPSDLVYSLL